MKVNPRRHPDPQSRIITISDKWLVERNPTTYAVVTMRPLCAIEALVRSQSDPQALQVIYRDGIVESYVCSYRDYLFSSLIDCGKASGNHSIVVTSIPPRRGLRLTPLGTLIDAQAEAQLIDALADFDMRTQSDAQSGLNYFGILLATFNANVPYAGLAHLNKHCQYKASIAALQNVLDVAPLSVATLQCIRRLTASRPGFEAFGDNAGVRGKLVELVFRGLKSTDDMVNYATIDVLATLLYPQFDADGDKTTDEVNKALVLGNAELVNQFMGVFGRNVVKGTGALIVMVCVEILVLVLCDVYSDTTREEHFEQVLLQVASIGRDLFKLFGANHCLSVVKGSGMVMKAIIEEGFEHAGLIENLQTSALVEGATLRHLHAALFTKGATSRQVIFRALSRELLAVWTAGCKPAEEMLARVFPRALLAYLDGTDVPPEDDEDAEAEGGDRGEGGGGGDEHGDGAGAKRSKKSIISSVLLKWQMRSTPRRSPAHQRVHKKRAGGSEEEGAPQRNWALFLYQFKRDHARADLIWNNHTREELREALEGELRVFRLEQEVQSAGAFISWNHQEFIVPYDCLKSEICVGGYFLRLLLNPPPGQKAPALKRPAEFFDMLFHRCLLEKDYHLQALAIQALTVVAKYYSAQLPAFADIGHIVTMLRQTTNVLVRDRLVQCVCVLIERPENAKLFVDAGGMQLLTELLTLVHFQADHIVAPQASNLLTAGADMAEGEWYYSAVTVPEATPENPAPAPRKEKFGPFNVAQMRRAFASGVVDVNTLCWAQGMDDWCPLREVTQLKWALLGEGTAVFTNYEFGGVVLDTFLTLVRLYPIRDAEGGIIRPIPRPKRILSSPQQLPHVVQVFLTRDPVLVEKTALLLSALLEDNLGSLPKLYLTGVYYFVLLYGGSNFLPIAKFLKETHLAQNFKDLKGVSELERVSILGPILPPAMIHLLERRGADEFTRVFLGKYDTPEAIWDADMRQLMIEKISVHLGNFPLRLATNPRAVYQYVPMAPIVYSGLAREVFCHHYYLRNLCDLTRFPMWPIESEVELLGAVLRAWALESEKPPPKITKEEALRLLDLRSDYKEEEIRRAYFRKAQKYHPDKNPEGRELFDKVHTAYTFLTTETEDNTREKLILILKTQSILYTRFCVQLSPYKYAGYPLLIKTIDDAYAARDKEVLRFCVELCYRTVKSTSLNAEELRRQKGVEKMVDILQDAVQALNAARTPEDLQCVLAFYVLLTLSVAVAYKECREVLCTRVSFLDDVCTALRCKVSPKVVEAALECVCCSALDETLQRLLFERYILFLLVPHLFHYDYTLDEAQAQAQAGPKAAQTQLNMNAGLALLSLGRLGGRDPAAFVDAHLQAAVDALLTKKITATICKRPMLDLLKDLNGNVVTPLLIWDNQTRAEVLSYVEANGPDVVNRPTIDGGLPPYDCSAFRFPSLEREVLVGDIYVRIFNEQPKYHAAIPDPKGFLVALTKYLPATVEAALSQDSQHGGSADGGADGKTDGSADGGVNGGVNSGIDGNRTGKDLVAPHLRPCTQPPPVERLTMCARAIANVLKANNGLESVLAVKQAMEMVVQPLRFIEQVELVDALLDVLLLLGRNGDCVASLAETEGFARLVPVLLLRGTRGTPVVLKALGLLHGLTANPKIVLDTHQYGGTLYLLRVFCSATERGGDTQPRVRAAEILAKMMADQAHGTLVYLALRKFVPAALVHAIRKDPEGALQMFEGAHDNPDLIWGSGTRAELRAFLERKCKEFFVHQREKPTFKFNLPEDFAFAYEELRDETVIGGVYVRNFLKQPTWPLSDPKEFTEAVLDRYITVLTRPSPVSDDPTAGIDLTQLKLAARVGHALFAANTQMCDHAAKTGHVAKLFSLLESPSVPKHSSLLVLLSVLMTSSLCAETCERFQSVRALVGVLRTNPKLAKPVCETLERMFTKNVCNAAMCYAKQLLEAPVTVKVLMKILDGSGDEMLGEHATEVKARLVSGLQALAREEMHGPQLLAELEKYPCWKTYGAQRHDLFITASQGPVGLLTGSTSGVVGLLTDSAAMHLPDAPPEL